MEEILKILVVDDEQLVRWLLIKSLKWADANSCVVGEADSAEEALALVESKKPDIVITDICMANMDGIQLGEILKNRYPSLKVVILTGHDRFDYAKRSIKVGISDFLLKPIDTKEIKKSMLKLRREILSERRHETEYRQLKEQLEQYRPYLRLNFLQDLVLGKMDLGILEEKSSYFGMDFTGSWFRAAVLEIRKNEADTEEARQILRLQSLNIIEDYFSGQPAILLFTDLSGRIVLLCCDKGSDLEARAADVEKLLSQSLSCHVTIGIGKIYEKAADISLSYQQAVYAIDYARFYDRQAIICYDEVAYPPSSDYELDESQLEKYRFYLKAGMQQQALDVVRSLLTPKGLTISMEHLRTVASTLLSSALFVSSTFNIGSGGPLMHPAALFSKLFSLETVSGIIRCLEQVTVQVIASQQEGASQRKEKFVNEMCRYIDANLSNSALSLPVVAEQFHVSTGYVSRNFKQATGMNFVKYLLKVRIERSIELLKTTSMLSYQVGEAVGIPDPHYFSICFKKYTGLSIMEYRKGHVQN